MHWLSYELLLQQDLSSAAGEKQRQQPQPMPTRQHCTVKGDVWALATTFWQIFSDGASPGEGTGGEDTDPETFRQAYLRGYTLAKPDKLGCVRLAKSIMHIACLKFPVFRHLLRQ